MNVELKKLKMARDEKLVSEVIDLTKALIAQPATGILIGFVGLKALARAGVLTGPETLVLGALIGSTTALQAFKPLDLRN